MYGYFDVTDFGAVGDGVTDASPAFQAANSAAVAAGGGYIYVPPGLYLLVTSILLGSTSVDVPITLGGNGGTLSILLAGNLRLPTGTFVAIMVANARWNTSSSTPVQHEIYIEKLGFNCSGALNHKLYSPIYLRQVQNCGVRDCELFNSSTNGITIIGTTDPAIWPGPQINFEIVRNHINLNLGNAGPTGAYPVQALGASIGRIDENVIGDQNAVNTLDAISFPGCSHVNCSDNYIASCANGIIAYKCDDCVIASNRILQPTGSAVTTEFDAATSESGVSDLAITGNTVIGARYSAIRVGSPNTADEAAQVAKRFAVTANVVMLSNGATGPAIDVKASEGCVTGNSIDLGGSNQAGIVIDSSHAAGGDHGGKGISCGDNQIAGGGSSSAGVTFLADSGNSFSDCSVTNNNVDGTSIAVPIKLPADLSLLIGCAIRDNLGINPYTASIIMPPGVPDKNVPLANPFPFDMDVYVKGGVFSYTMVNNQSTGITNGRFFLEAGEDLLELWTRIVFNIMASNTDDLLAITAFCSLRMGGNSLRPMTRIRILIR